MSNTLIAKTVIYKPQVSTKIDVLRSSASLPSNLDALLGVYVAIEMDLERPYTQYELQKNKQLPGRPKKKRFGIHIRLENV